MLKAQLARFALASFLVSTATRAYSAGSDTTVPPSEAEQKHLLDSMRDYADQYTEKLPNFICQQVTEQYEAGKKPTHWRKGDTLTAKLVFNQGHEQRTLEQVNNKPTRFTGRPWRTPLTTEGEFGILLSNVFEPSTEAQFSWSGWDTFHGRQVAKFDYSVAREHSTLSLSLSDLAKAIVAYHGSVYADPASGAVWRITSESSVIPDSVRTKSIATTIDYDAVKIGSQNYLLPVAATVLMITDANHIRNEMQFQNYRKFEAESTITFGSEASDPAHPPEGAPKAPQ